MTETYDIIVLGGGAAGITASIQAARLNAKTLLVEKQAQLGGTTTTAGINGIQTFFAYGQQIIAGIGWELVNKTYQALNLPAPSGNNFNDKNGITNTEVDRAVYSAIVDQAVLEAGVELRLHTMLGAIKQNPDGSQNPSWTLTLCGKEGLYDVHAKVVIDCSGDANAISLAGLPVTRLTDRQPGTLVLKLAGYDYKTLDIPTIQANFDAQVTAGALKHSDTGWFKGSIIPLLQSYGGNRIHVLNENAADSKGRTHAELEARRIMLRLIKFFRSQQGLENFTVTWFAPECGVRETVQIQGRKSITVDDWMSGKLHDDAVSFSFYPIDVHTEVGLIYRTLPRGIVPTIPYGAMLPLSGTNILAAGRCIAGDREAFSAYRIQASCMGMGQAAGAAAAIAARMGIPVADIDLATLRQTLQRHAAIVPVIAPHAPTSQAQQPILN